MGALAVETDLFVADRRGDAWSGLRAGLEVVEQNKEPSVLREELDPRLLASELVLVCPELRAISLALLPDRDPDAFLRRTGSTECRPTPTPAESASASTELEPEPTRAGPAPSRQGVRPLAVAALAHVVGQTLLTAVTGATIFAGLAGIVLLATSLR